MNAHAPQQEVGSFNRFAAQTPARSGPRAPRSPAGPAAGAPENRCPRGGKDTREAGQKSPGIVHFPVPLFSSVKQRWEEHLPNVVLVTMK